MKHQSLDIGHDPAAHGPRDSGGGPIARIRRYYELRRAYDTLWRFSDRELQDIGLVRGNLKAAVFGPPQPRFAWIRDMAASVARRFGDWRRRRRAFLELEALDDRMLSDIGVTRDDIPAVAGGASSEPPAPANALQPRTAA